MGFFLRSHYLLLQLLLRQQLPLNSFGLFNFSYLSFVLLLTLVKLNFDYLLLLSRFLIELDFPRVVHLFAPVTNIGFRLELAPHFCQLIRNIGLEIHSLCAFETRCTSQANCLFKSIFHLVFFKGGKILLNVVSQLLELLETLCKPVDEVLGVGLWRLRKDPLHVCHERLRRILHD